MALSRYEHTGAAPVTGLASGIGSTDTTFTVNSGTGYPTGATGKFVICVDAGTVSEEKILCSARSGTSFTVAASGRGYDGTTATSHSSGSTNVTHVLSAAEIDDASDHIYTTTRDDHTQYARTDGTRAFTGGVTVNSGGATVAGGLTVSGGGAQVTGNSKVTGTLETTAALTVDAGGVTVTAGGVTVAAGGASVTGNSTVTGNLTVTGTITTGGVSTVPSGALMDFAGSAAPTGWLLCDGSAVSRTTYAGLFSAIGTTWGTGDGSTTFNVPDFRGRTSIGSGTGSGLSPRTLAATGGEETHALTASEGASHTHTDSGHTHDLKGQFDGHELSGASGEFVAVSYSTNTAHAFPGTAINGGYDAINVQTGTASLSTSGSGTGHNTMMPFAVVTKIIKT